MSCMVVTIFDGVADAEVFDGWVCEVRSAARGFLRLSSDLVIIVCAVLPPLNSPAMKARTSSLRM